MTMPGLSPPRLAARLGVALFCCLSLLPGSRAAAGAQLRIGAEGAYPPFEYRDASGAIKGFDVDIGNALCARMQVTCVWVAQSFDGLIPALKAGKIDMIMSSLSVTAERARVIDFSKPYFQTPSQLVALRTAGITDDPATLKGKTIGVQSGTIQQTYMDQRRPDITTKAYDTLEDLELDLESGRVDAILADKLVMYDWLMKEGAAKGFDFAGTPIDDPILKGDVAVGIAKGNAALKAALDGAIDNILSDGTFDRIANGYFTFSIRPR